ncbi:MAG: hypothetical protein WCT50_01065 [Patescibacteria group bacterium]|jgi:hypothetical protein
MVKFPEIPETQGVLNYLEQAFNVYFEGRSNKSKAFEMAAFKLGQFIYSRELRLDDVKSPEVQKAIRIKNSLFPYGVPYFVLCMDVRVRPKLIGCFHGHAFCTPAGDIRNEFLPSKNSPGNLFLISGAFSDMLDEAFKDQDFVNQIFDSHLYCAAGGLRANDFHAMKVLDSGLRDDVIRKTKMKRAAIEHVTQKYGNRKQLFVIQTSFNPINGYCYLGLDKEECLYDGRVISQGYTDEILSALSSEDKIISTEKLVAMKAVKELFIQHYFNCDYLADYRESSLQFWNNIKKMRSKLYQIFEKEVKRIIGSMAPEELEQTTLFLMANAYNAFLHNFFADGSAKSYLYNVHNESVIAVTISGKDPFDRATSFALDPKSSTLPSDLVFGYNLVRKNRAEKRMSSYERKAVEQVFDGNFQEYVNNPVLAMFFERTWEELSVLETKKLMQIDWSDLVKIDWINMSDDQFRRDYLSKKISDLSMVAASAINNLRKQAITLFQPGLSSTELMLDGRIIPVFILAGPNRKTIALLPFLINGY